MINFIEQMSNMPVKELVGHIILIIGVISAIIEKSKKLPFNPWSAIFKWIGARTNAPIYDKINQLDETMAETKDYMIEMKEEYIDSIASIKEDYNGRIDKLERDADEKEAKRLRANIICFSDACRADTVYTKQHFENIFRDYDDYEAYCKRHQFENHFIEGEMKYISTVYAKRLENNEF